MFGLVPFSSRNSLAKKEDAFGRLFDMFNEPFFDTELAPISKWMGGISTFKVDVKDLDAAYELTADLPGVKKENIALHYENSYLTISAKKEENAESNDEANNYIRRERHMGGVSRSFYIDNIDEAKVSAEFKEGILKIILPKCTLQDKPKQIEIN